MQITDVRVFPVRDEKLKAFVSVVFESCFMVNDIKVINGRDGYFISMPSRRKKNGEFKDIAHPLNTETRRLLEERILDEYEQVVALDDPVARRYEKTEASGDRKPKRKPEPERESRDGEASGSVAESSTASEPDESSSDARERGDESTTAAPTDVEGAVNRGAEVAASDGGRDESTDDDRGQKRGERRDLDEVVEDHLSDSFWS